MELWSIDRSPNNICVWVSVYIQEGFEHQEDYLQVLVRFWEAWFHTISFRLTCMHVKDRPIIGADFQHLASAFLLIRRPIRYQFQTGLFWLWCSRHSLSVVSTLSPALFPTTPSDWLHTEPGNSQSAVRAVHAHCSHTLQLTTTGNFTVCPIRLYKHKQQLCSLELVRFMSQLFKTHDSFYWLGSYESLSPLTPSLTHRCYCQLTAKRRHVTKLLF